MMARTKRSRRSYSAGEWGRNRVRVFADPKTGLYQIEWRDNGRRLTRSLKHRDWARAKRQADEVAAGLAVHEPNGKAESEPEPLTLEMLFDIYGEEVTPNKAYTSRMHDRAATAMFLDFLGRDRRPGTLSRRDWDRFIRARRVGRVGPSGQPVSDQTIHGDLTFLMAVLNWAARSRDEHGRLLLDRNPLKGLRKPVEKNPVRVVVTDKEYRALLKVSRQVGWRFHVALVLATRPGTESGLSGTSGGPISTSNAKPSGGAASTRRRDTSTGRRCPQRRSSCSSRRGRGAPGSWTRRCCPRRSIP